jgi:hypothetical protein
MAVKDAFIANMCALSWASVTYEIEAKTYCFKSRVSVEKWVPAGFSVRVDRLNDFIEDVNNLYCDRAVVHNEVISIIMDLP